MTADDTTPETGHESIDIGREGFPLRDETDEDLALVLEDQKQEGKDAVNAVTRALLNGSEPLTDEKVRELSEVGDALTALSRTLSVRVPDEYRAETHGEHQEMYGGD